MGAAGVVVSAISSLYIARRNIHKDSRSRARIEWMISLRTHLAELVSAIDQVRRERINGDEVKINAANGVMLRAQLKLQLLLNDSKAHMEFEASIKLCVDQVYNDGLIYNPEPDLNNSIRAARIILNNEWIKASRGK